MRKIFTDRKEGGKFVLNGDNHRHLAFSLRSRIGDKLIVCHDGTDYECEITAITKTETILKILCSRPAEGEPTINVTLFFALMKNDKNDMVVQKCTELGVCGLQPFVSQNCECRPENFRSERLTKIAAMAAQQCGRGKIPELFAVADLEEIAKQLGRYDRVIFPYEGERETAAKDVISKISDGENIAVIIGSEGGFTRAEADRLIAAGAKAVTLGKRILRAETAAVAVVSAVMYEANQWKIS